MGEEDGSTIGSGHRHDQRATLGVLRLLGAGDCQAAGELAELQLHRASSPAVRALAAKVLGRQKPGSHLGTLHRALDDPHPLVRRRVAETLARIGDASSLDAVERCLEQHGEDRRVRLSLLLLGYATGSAVHLADCAGAGLVRSRPAADTLRPVIFERIAPATAGLTAAEVTKHAPNGRFAAAELYRFGCHTLRQLLVLDAAAVADVVVGGRSSAIAGFVGTTTGPGRARLVCHVLIDRGVENGARLTVVRPSGTIIHGGRIYSQGGFPAGVELGEVHPQRGRAVDLYGTYSPDQGLVIEGAVASCAA